MDTQEIYDNTVLAIADRGIDLAERACDLRRQGDPAARRLEEEYMMLQNVLSALKNYDVESELLEDADVDYMKELAASIVETNPNNIIPAPTFVAEVPTLFDYVLPCFIRNLERNNISPDPDTRWHITHKDAVNGTITVDQDLPEELADFGTGVNNRWFLSTGPAGWVYISGVDFDTRTITYSYIHGVVAEGDHASWFCPFRSFTLDPEDHIIDVTAWATVWVEAGPVWKHSDGTYRMVANGYNGVYNTLTLYSSPDLETWTLVGASYKYKAGTHPFDESWCVGTVNLTLYGNMVQIEGGTYDGKYLGIVEGANSGGIRKCAAVIFDEDFEVVYMPTAELVITGYETDATDKYCFGHGTFYFNDLLYCAINYRHVTPDNLFTMLMVQLDGPEDPTVVSVKEVVRNQRPNSWMSLSVPGGPIFEFNDVLYCLLIGENNSADEADTPMGSNFECGIASRSSTGVWTPHKDSPLIMNPVALDDVYTAMEWCSDAMGIINVYIEDNVMYVFATMKNGTDGYRIGRLTLNLS